MGTRNNSRELFMSDGTSDIRVVDPETFGEKRHFKVHDGPKPIDQLNEMEFVEGQIFANVWHTTASLGFLLKRVPWWGGLTSVDF